jgi:hypothetical protein
LLQPDAAAGAGGAGGKGLPGQLTAKQEKALEKKEKVGPVVVIVIVIIAVAVAVNYASIT